MSNYTIKAKHNTTGEVVEVTVLDNYFKLHGYGYKIGDKVLCEDDFASEYEELPPTESNQQMV